MKWTEKLLARYLKGQQYNVVYEHSCCVARKALKVCEALELGAAERLFIEEAALLHDIGVSMVYAPGIYMYGEHPYIMHGVLGREILENEGHPVHALIAERHTGVGLTVEDIVRQNLPLPQRDMCPLSLAEKIICFSDLFYSKKPGRLGLERSADSIRKQLASFGEDNVAVFDRWMIDFGR